MRSKLEAAGGGHEAVFAGQPDCIGREVTLRVFVKKSELAAKGSSDAVRSFVARSARPRSASGFANTRSDCLALAAKP